MKKITLAALLAVSFAIIFSCNEKSEQATTSNPLIGQWKIDSIATPNNDIGALLLAMALQDSSDYDMSFTADSVLVHQKDTITKSAYSFNSPQEQLLIKEDSTVFIYQQISPNYIKLTDKDSTTLFLRKHQQ